jgi:hypothetical protein
MKRNQIVLGIGVMAAVLALSVTGFAQNKVFLSPNETQTISLSNGPNQVVPVGALCSGSCNITWMLITSNSAVGSIDNKSGPQTNFLVGTLAGTAHIIASDGQGNMAVLKIVVSP